MDLIVYTPIASVGITYPIGCDEGVIEGGVEAGEILLLPLFYLDFREKSAPLLFCIGTDLVESRAAP